MTDRPSSELDEINFNDLTHIETLPSYNEVQIKYPDIAAFVEASGLIGVDAVFTLKRKPRKKSIINEARIEGRDMSTRQSSAIQLDAILTVPDNTNAGDIFDAIVDNENKKEGPEDLSRYCEFHSNERDDTILIATPNGQVIVAYPYAAGLIRITNKGTLPAKKNDDSDILAIAPDAFNEVGPDSQVIDFCIAVTEFIEAADKSCMDMKTTGKPVVYTFDLLGRAKEIAESSAKHIGRIASSPLRNAAMIPEQEKLDETPMPRFKDIAGYEKELALLERTLTINKNYAYAKTRFGLEPTRGILLQGPAGVGKTLLATACATELGAQLLTVSNEDIIAPNIGESARNLDKIFKEASAANEPVVLLLENIDAILGSGSIGTDRGMLATFRKHVRSNPDHNVLVVATAPPAGYMIGGPDLSTLFETTLTMSLPNESDRLAIFAKFVTEGTAKVFYGSEDSHNVPQPLRTNVYYRIFSDDLDIAALAAQTSGFSGADIRDAIKLSKLLCFERELESDGLSLISQADILHAIQTLRQK